MRLPEINYVDAIMVVAALVVILSCYRAQRDPNFRFDIFDLIMQDGRLSKTSVAFMTTLAVTSWVLIKLTVDGKMTETLYTAYGAMWVAPLVVKILKGAESDKGAEPARQQRLPKDPADQKETP